MVYYGEEEVGARKHSNMATGPERSKPLHNFVLPLRWGNQKYLRCVKEDFTAGVSSSDLRLRRRSPSTASCLRVRASGGVEPERIRREGTADERRDGPRMAAWGSGADGGEEGINEVRQKIMMDLKTAAETIKESILRDEVSEDEAEKEERARARRGGENGKEKVVEREEHPVAEVETVKPWNLRTRRSGWRLPMGVAGNIVVKKINNSNKGLKIEEKRVKHSPYRNDFTRSPRNRGIYSERDGAGGGGGSPPAKVWPKFFVSLSKEEIEADFMKMLGHRPPRRPKKRPRNVQRQLDLLFPGLELSEITPDTYKVPESPENNKK